MRWKRIWSSLLPSLISATSSLRIWDVSNLAYGCLTKRVCLEFEFPVDSGPLSRLAPANACLGRGFGKALRKSARRERADNFMIQRATAPLSDLRLARAECGLSSAIAKRGARMAVEPKTPED
jgi:hypothetical protein